MACTRRYTTAQVIAALEHCHGLLHLTARVLGCTRQTVWNYMQRDPAVRAAVDAQRGLLLDTCEVKLWEAIRRNEAWAIVFALRYLGRQRGYVPQVVVGTGLEGLSTMLEEARQVQRQARRQR